jgi:hypothetical protein
MIPRIGIATAGERSASEVAARSRRALDAPLTEKVELWTAVLRDGALLVGSYQRTHGLPTTWPRLRRGSGGPEVIVGPGTVHLALSLAHPGALLAADAKRIANRNVRPLLRALTRLGQAAHFFGRDWVSIAHRPAAWVGYAHDATTHRTLFEAFVAVASPFATTQRPSFLGIPPATLEALAGRSVDPHRVVSFIVSAYAEGRDPVALDVAKTDGQPEDEPLSEPPWTATTEVAIGTLGAGADSSGAFRIGGDLLVSRDALTRLEGRVAAIDPRSPAFDTDVAVAVEETLTAPEVAFDGVRSLDSLREVIARAGLLPPPKSWAP